MSGFSTEEYILLNSVSDGVTVNSQGIFSYVNTTFAEMVGYGVSELIGMNVLEVTAPEYVDLINERTRKRQQGLEVVSIYELELVRKDGTRFPVEFNATRIDFDGKSSSLTIIRDTYERKQAEKALVESEERYRGLFDSLIDGFAYHQAVYNDKGEPVDYTYIEINDRFTELVGLGREIIGRNVTEVLPGIEDDPADWIKVYGELAKNFGELRFEQYAEPLGKWFSVSAYSPNPGYFATIFQDISERKQIEETLQKSEETYRAFSESATESFVLFDSELNMVNINTIGAERLGYTIEELIGRPMLETMPHLRGSERYERYLEVLKTGEPQIFDIVGQISGIRRLRINVFKVGDGLGIIASDLSELLKAQEERARSESEKKAILDSLPDPLFVTTHKHFLYINKSGAQVLRIQNPEEIIGKPLDEVIPPDASNSIRQLMKDKLEGKPVPEKYDIPIPVGDNKFLTMEANISVIDFEGTPAIITSMRDITQVKQYQERLEVLHRHAVELDNATTEKEIVNISGRVMTDSLNYEIIDVITVKDDYLHDSYPKYSGFKSHISDKGIVTRAARTQETQFVPDTREDEDYTVGVHSSVQRSEISVPVVSQGVTVAVLNIESKEPNAFSLHDKELLETLASHIASAYDRINQIERLEQQVKERTEQLVEMDHVKTQFIRTAAHELRTPVTVIQGFLEIISQDYRDSLPEDVVKMLEVVDRNTQRLTNLTNDLLDLQHLESGSLSLNLETGNINDLITTACRELEPHLDGDRLEYSLNLGDLPDSSFDQNRISQVIVNLILNAIKFTPEKGVIGVSSWVDDDWICVQVRDEGIGLAEDDVRSLFRPFPGIEHGLNVSSTGLGLSICKGIVELHGGEIWAESAGKGEGSTFSFKIPL